MRLNSPYSRPGILLPTGSDNRHCISRLALLAEIKLFPRTIYSVLARIGGFEKGGALGWVGCTDESLHELRWRHPARDFGSLVCGLRSTWDDSRSRLDFTVGIEFPVNGLPDEYWRMAITAETNERFSVWLWADNTDGVGRPCLLGNSVDVSIEDLGETIPALYHAEIRARRPGCDRTGDWSINPCSFLSSSP